jgi:membrane-associated phospholipid phosphatase
MLDRRNASHRAILLALAWTLAACCCLPIDLPLSRWMLDGLLPGELRGMLRRAELFGHAYGLLGILITIFLLDPARRGKLWHAATCFLAAGLAADAIKLQVWRMRPRPYLEGGFAGSTFLGSIWTSSEGLSWSKLADNAQHSFPSAHTAAAVAFAYSLSGLYPTARKWFYTLALLCAMNRIDGGAHFASDVCIGVALGHVIAVHLPSSDRLEAWIGRRLGRPTSGAERPRELNKAA